MLISVVIPCYNVEEYIDDCLHSILEQEYKNLEVIVVNDGSKDRTSQILSSWEKSGSLQIKVIEIKNSGAGAARNRGIRESKGKYIQFLDADDLLHPFKIAHQVSLIEKNNGKPDFIAATYKSKDKKGQTTLFEPDHRGVWYGLLSSNLGITSANFFKKESLREVGGFDVSLASSQEYDLMFRLLKRPSCSVLFDNAMYTIKRDINAEAISSGNQKANILRFVSLRKRMLEYLESSGSLTDDLYKTWCEVVFNAIKRLYQYDRYESIRLYNKLIPQSFVPALSGAISKKYQFFYRYFGFRVAQYLYSLKMKWY
ncbi:glycosyltransferase family 2 protein [Aliifodinibius salicampi]|uniref:Glycosyltransferase family 2 protein n=1 Tax=Fodinibius salicampi TaxID=1920655 RepID=A0ABT3PV30_9BACT|nr:glycosyltransferase family A protein [Fodinibius salicampi]MCW9711714.1 glycosyltransferase family 2 protein [Fodinibius salicampi]